MDEPLIITKPLKGREGEEVLVYCECGGVARVKIKELISQGVVVVKCNLRGHPLEVRYVGVPYVEISVKRE